MDIVDDEQPETIHPEFSVINNDRQNESMVQLLRLRNLFSKALVKMPRDYLVRMIFDRRHYTYTMFRDDGSIVGGLCFRPFAHRGFAEVVFLAISSGDQVRGKGTRLMNHYKEYCKRELGIKYLLTYADNFATGYFKKQGFTEELTLPTSYWKGYIKDYDGGTMMGCRLYDHLDYRDVSGSIRDIIREVYETVSNPQSKSQIYVGHEKFPADPSTIPGLEHLRYEDISSGCGPIETQISTILSAAVKEPSSWAFREPVDEKLVPGYHSVISSPMDLLTMKLKNERREYKHRDQFRADVKLMIDNCVLFNGPRHEVTKRGFEITNFMFSRIDKIVEYAPR
jgi:histone acetyltransferase